MSATERLYLADPFTLSFEARVVGHGELEGARSVVLDRSAFYPESGGQLADRGVLGGFRVHDVQIDDDGVVHHRLAGDDVPAIGDVVVGEVERARRRSHMALHTGQHMLSRALLDAAGAETVSSRLGESTCTIDVHLAELVPARALEAVARVNEIIDADVEVRAFFPSPDELRRLPLRREPKVDKEVRVIDVVGFDVSPCGGTHCTRSSQVGLVRLTGLERYKGKVRVSFSAGPRARQELLDESEVLRALSRRFTCGLFDVPQAVDALERNLAEVRGELSRARAQQLESLADEVERRADEAGSQLVVEVLNGADADALRTVAGRVTRAPQRVALLAAPTDDGLHVVVARGAESAFDCGAFLKAAREKVGGKGGGKAERAEGRLPAGTDLLALARDLASS